MKFLPLSDLHFEFHKDDGKEFIKSLPTDISADVGAVILAGDICSLEQLPDTLRRFSDRYAYVFYTWGNHECYGASIAEVRDAVHYLEDEIFNLYVLDNTTFEFKHFKIGGTTLWFPDQENNSHFEPWLDDFQVIDDFKPYEENKRAIDYLQSEKTNDIDIMVTHHLPSPMSIHSGYEGHVLNRFFLCDVEDKIKEKQPKLWIHGHTHCSFDYTIFRTRVVCNPLGYPIELNPQFRSDLLIELS